MSQQTDCFATLGMKKRAETTYSAQKTCNTIHVLYLSKLKVLCEISWFVSYRW